YLQYNGGRKLHLEANHGERPAIGGNPGIQAGIHDLDSSNGTVLNDLHLRPLSLADLNDDDVVKFNEYTYIKVEIQVRSGPNQLLWQNPRRHTTKGGDVVTEDLNLTDGSRWC
ncbi:hypothetical protein U1Q18_009390, partial [Sarracenia purpurea var. burkii]